MRRRYGLDGLRLRTVFGLLRHHRPVAGDHPYKPPTCSPEHLSVAPNYSCITTSTKITDVAFPRPIASPALRGYQDWCVEPKKAQRSRCLPVSQPHSAVRARGGELPPARAERRRVHLVGVAGEDAVQCGRLGAGQTPPGREIPRRQQRIQPVTVDPGGRASQPSLQGRGHLSRIRQPREQVGMLDQPPPSFL